MPLFVEELTKTIRESGLLADVGDRYEATSPLLALSVPATLRDSLVARLDRLGTAKEVAQIGAAIGREFPYALLAAVSASADRSLEDALVRLEKSELVFRHGVPPEATYRFKHALIQEAAHDSLLKSKRQQLHSRIAVVLEQERREGERQIFEARWQRRVLHADEQQRSPIRHLLDAEGLRCRQPMPRPEKRHGVFKQS